jgi:hypothetical protein
MASRPALLLCTALVVLTGSPNPSTAQQGARRAADIELPPITWACPMNGVAMPDGTTHAEVHEPAKGSCPICKMALAAVRLDSIWTCPVHSVIAEKQGGRCPIDRRDLVQVTVGVSWTCAGRPEIDQIVPGTCADGSATIVKYTPRPHGNHNPQHGGQFFMAPDNWHHLEGALPQQRVVRIYLYDNYTKPLPRDRMKPVGGRIIVKDGARELSFPLAQSRDGQYLEAEVDSRSLPLSVVAKLKLKESGPEYHFDFRFTELSKEPPPIPATTFPVSPDTPTTPVDPSPMPQLPAPLIQVSIPDTIEGIVAEIGIRNRQIGELIDSGRFPDVWFPAFEAKDLALAMSAHAATIPAARQQLLEPAIKRLLHSAWLLDAFGDVGNREQITTVYKDFQSAVSGIESLIQRPAPGSGGGAR